VLVELAWPAARAPDDTGALVALTGARTGRSPKDKYVVDEPATRELIWRGPNQPLDEAAFERLLGRVRSYFQGRELFVCDGSACADPAYALPVRVVGELAWHSLFARCLLRGPVAAAPLEPLTILCAADMHADPAVDGTKGETFIVLHLERRIVLIGGTRYAGEIKKSIFTYLNYLLPQLGVFPMHCGANLGGDGSSALFFGLSGTGKTTLSADPGRRLIGDDEHGWSSAGVFNLEGGCYAKCIRLSREGEPQIWNAIRFGSVLENVVVDPRTRRADYDDPNYTENTRAAYPVDYIDNAEPTSRGGHPSALLFLTCDAFGVLPPLARLTPDQALYHFLSGYTAKVAGTEAGVKEPEATFSTCFAAPFLPLPPGEVRGPAARAAADARQRRLAGQHRLERRPVRAGQPFQTGVHAGVGAGRDRRAAQRRAVCPGPGVRRDGAAGVSRRAGGDAAAARHLAERRRLRRRGAATGRAVPGQLREVRRTSAGGAAPRRPAGVTAEQQAEFPGAAAAAPGVRRGGR